MQKSKKVRMPAGIRNKLMAAIAMLLVSSIMMVSSTYAWFTLSTAPEVTGITTSVGANGNLEMALLNGQTYKNTDLIKSGTSDSIAATGNVVASNITWGNLVDLSDISYGLNLIALNPATPNYMMEEKEGSQTENEFKINPTSLLKTAEYGSDGRVVELKANTSTGVYNSGKWVGKQTLKNENDVDQAYDAYGVRAIGVDSNQTPAERILNEAKRAFNENKNKASSPAANAVDNNDSVFFGMLKKADGATYGNEELTALYEVALGVQTSLNNIVKAYSNAAIAKAATTITDEAKLTALRDQLTNNTSATTLNSLMTSAGVENSYSARLTAIAADQSSVAAILNMFTVDSTGAVTSCAATNVKEQVMKPLIGDSTTVWALDKDKKSVELSEENATSITSVYITGGLLGTIASEAGSYYMTTYVFVPVYAAGAATEDSETKVVTVTEAGYLDTAAGNLSTLSITPAEGAEKTIADFYGYVIDFAFRTNAASSFLQLQTSPVNRVYSDAEGADLATQGSGSTATFAFNEEMTQTQVTALLEAVNLVFMGITDTSADVYATAELSGIKFNSANHTATADVVLKERSTKDDANATATSIVALPQNIPTKVSVMVYLEGDDVDNSTVANAASSGMLELNLQFSSSANLIPMQNTALENMVITYTELTAEDDPDYVAGLYTFNSALYDIKDGYHIYKGSDGMTYFGQIAAGATEPAEYTKLTVVTASTALTPVTVNVESSSGSNLVEIGTPVTLTAKIAGNSDFATKHTLTSFTWSTADTNITLPSDDVTTDNKVVVTGESDGDATITGTIVFTTTYDVKAKDGTVTGTSTRDTTVKITYPVTVTAADNNQQGGGTQTTTYTVTINENAAAAATAGQAYSFTIEDATLTNVTYKVGEGEATSITATNGTYTIPADKVTGNIVITATV